MVFSPTANMLSKAIDASPLTQRDISDRVGFRNANIISMMKTGETRVPLNRIPALSHALAIDERQLLMLAIEEYHPGVHEVLIDVLGLPLSDAELGILSILRMASLLDVFEIEGPFKQVLEGLLDLAALTKKSL